MHKYWYTILLSFSLFIAAAAAMIGGVLMKPEAGKTVKQDFAASAAVRDPAFPVSAALSSTLPETLRPSDSLKALPLPAPPESPPSPSEPSKPSGNAPGEPGSDGWKKELGAVSPDLTDVLFIGDSRTVGLSEYGDLGNADVFADSGMSVFNLLDSKPKKGAGSDKTLNQLLEEKNYKAVFLMLGINELGYGNQNILKQYRTVVSYIKEKQPEAVLILEANLHVTKTKSDRSPIYNNENINALNQGIKQIAAEENCPYMDVNVIFDDESGNLNETYTTDGSHVLGKYYALWTEWIFD